MSNSDPYTKVKEYIDNDQKISKTFGTIESHYLSLLGEKNISTIGLGDNIKSGHANFESVIKGTLASGELHTKLKFEDGQWNIESAEIQLVN